jgi:hypothetical protein
VTAYGEAALLRADRPLILGDQAGVMRPHGQMRSMTIRSRGRNFLRYSLTQRTETAICFWPWG